MGNSEEKEMRKKSVRAYDLWLVPIPENTLKTMEKTPEVVTALEGCAKQPEQKIWNTLWEIRQRKGDQIVVGYLQFLGAPLQGKVRLRFQINKRQEGKRYATDAVRGIVNWAFAQKGIYEVEAVVDPINDAAICVLDRAGFVIRKHTRLEDTYSVTRQRTSWLGIYIVIGIFIGGTFGILFNSMVLGVAIGLGLCALTGASMDLKERKEEENATGKRSGVSRRKKKIDRNAKATEEDVQEIIGEEEEFFFGRRDKEVSEAAEENEAVEVSEAAEESITE